jgi:spermidine synthase
VLSVPSGNPGNIIVMAFKKIPNEVRIPELKDKIKLLEKRFGLELMVYFNRLIESNTSIDAHRLKFI